jgi:hypothetical protein
MNGFKQAAIKILSESNKSLHYREITKQALDRGIIKSDGKTPWATMNALLSMDIKQFGLNSSFVRTTPGSYSINIDLHNEEKRSGSYIEQKTIHYNQDGTSTEKIRLYSIANNLTTKQKGDITEARVAELITLYGEEGLSCYKPISDDEGIDLIVKRRGKLEVVYIQVKSTYGDSRGRGFVSTVKEKTLKDKARMLIVFVMFDLSVGDLYDQVFCIPAPEFLKLTINDDKKPGMRVFTVGLNHPEKSKYAEFMIEKRELANRVVEIMDKL